MRSSPVAVMYVLVRFTEGLRGVETKLRSPQYYTMLLHKDSAPRRESSCVSECTKPHASPRQPNCRLKGSGRMRSKQRGRTECEYVAHRVAVVILRRELRLHETPCSARHPALIAAHARRRRSHPKRITSPFQ